MIRFEVQKPMYGVFKCLVWRDRTWQTTGYGRSALEAASHARHAYKVHHAPRFPEFAERQVVAYRKKHGNVRFSQ